MSRPRLCDCGSCLRCRRRDSARRFRDNNPYYNDRYTARGQALIEAAKDVPCMDCGVRHPHFVMDFDHVRGDKSFTIGSVARATNVEKLLDEIAKCDAVCANCHRARTHERRTQ